MGTYEDDLLVGSTGFVGKNLARQHSFCEAVHSTDMSRVYDTRPALCVYAGVPSAMFLANGDPEADRAVMRIARENLRRIRPKKVVLVSTIAVYADSRGMDETSPTNGDGLAPYGTNRLQLEKWVREDFDDSMVVRLAGASAPVPATRSVLLGLIAGGFGLVVGACVAIAGRRSSGGARSD